VIQTLDAVLIESNYDPQMLDEGPYLESIKRRIRGRRGHLSNFESAELVRTAGRRLQWVCLAHLSEQNNDPDLAVETHRGMLDERLPIFVASRHEATGVFEL
jgi:phosphoribosyl 1,2-cyclic phosphodiesterase